jgi:hypothetical protein
MNEWVWSNGGMILTGENRSTGRKALYSVCGRWMNEYGAMVEWYWQGKTKVLGEKSLCQRHIFRHKSLFICKGTELRPPLGEAINEPPVPLHDLYSLLRHLLTKKAQLLILLVHSKLWFWDYFWDSVLEISGWRLCVCMAYQSVG